MENYEIKEKIDANNQRIEELINPTVFTLNKKVADLLDENVALRKQCKHSFVNGRCEFCYEFEEDNQ